MKKAKKSLRANGVKEAQSGRPNGQPSITSFMIKKSLYTTIKPQPDDKKQSEVTSSKSALASDSNDDSDFCIPQTPPCATKSKIVRRSSFHTHVHSTVEKSASNSIRPKDDSDSLTDDDDFIPPTPQVRKSKTKFTISKELSYNTKPLDTSAFEDNDFDSDSLIPPTPECKTTKKVSTFTTCTSKTNWFSVVKDSILRKRQNENLSPNADIELKKSCKNLQSSLDKSDLESMSQCDPAVEVTAKLKDVSTMLNRNYSDSLVSDVESPDVLDKNITSLNCDFSFDEDFENMSPFKDSQEKESIPHGQTRFIVKSVHPVSACEKVVTLAPDISDKETKLRCTCYLRDVWADSDVNAGDVVNIVDADIKNGSVTIDSNSGLLIIHPDTLISSTSIASTLFCQRKTVLSEIFKGWESGNKAMLVGSIVHEIFQKAVQERFTSLDKIQQVMIEILQSPKILQEIHGNNVPFNDVKFEVQRYMGQVKSWMETFSSGKRGQLNESSLHAEVVGVRDIEENYWSPKFGLKGKIDVTVEVKIHSSKSSKVSERTKILPLELKTGKPSFSVEHQGQIILYSLMMKERYEDPRCGLLLYLQGAPLMRLIEAQHHKQSGLIQMRNELAKYLTTCDKENLLLPEPTTNYRYCGGCPMLLPCSIMEKLETLKLEERSTCKERNNLVVNATKHLSEAHLNYFAHWFRLIQLEASASAKKNGSKSFWIDDPSKRQAKGLCYMNMKILHVKSTAKRVEPVLYHIFTKCNPKESLDVTLFKVNDTVVVSKEGTPTELAVSIGSVVQLTENEVHLSLDKDLRKRRNWSEEIYSINSYASTATMATNFRNLGRLLIDSPRINRMRELIVDKSDSKWLSGLPRSTVSLLRPIIKDLNKDQIRAIFKTLMAEDFIVIQGLPGSGKTSTIVCIVQILVALGRSVLLTSYTHSAVDNILLKLKCHNVNFMRMGKTSKVHPELSEHTSEARLGNLKTLEELTEFCNSVPVIATTCLSVKSAIFERRKFDVCIVDEASQILQTVCLGPLFLAKTFVLVGDSKQLPPLAQSVEAREKGICESLFSRLESPNNMIELTVQYRMNEEIMYISNKLTYGDKLVAGNDLVAKATLCLTKPKTEPKCEAWKKVLSTNLSDSVLFLNTEEIHAVESNNNKGLINNASEAAIVAAITEKFVKECGLCEKELGVICPYRDQIRLIKEKLLPMGLNVEINTVDQYQGRDKAAIIFSCVRSSTKNGEIKLGEILHDSKRLNVALTRAKRKLILIGDKSTLNLYTPFENLFKILRSDQCVMLQSLL